jgi:hypothetical protein
MAKNEPDWEPLMRFRLTYEGELQSTQGEPRDGQRVPLAAHKQAIRKEFHGQLKQLLGRAINTGGAYNVRCKGNRARTR